MKKIIYGILGIVVIMILAVIAINFAKVDEQNLKNQVGSDVAFYDENRRFIQSLSLNCEVDTEDKFEQEFEVEEGKTMELSLEHDTLSQDIEIEVCDGTGKQILKEEVEGSNSQQVKMNGDFASGKYTLYIYFRKNTTGTLELNWNEK